MMTPYSSTWTPYKIDKLRQLWSDEHSLSEIGRMLGVTRNAVAGKVHRLGLTPRKSPIIRHAPINRKVPEGYRGW